MTLKFRCWNQKCALCDDGCNFKDHHNCGAPPRLCPRGAYCQKCNRQHAFKPVRKLRVAA